MIIHRITDMLLHITYPIDLPKVIGDIHALMSEHAHCDIYLPEATVRKAVLTSLDIMEGTGYDIDTLLEELENEQGLYELDRAEAISGRNEISEN